MKIFKPKLFSLLLGLLMLGWALTSCSGQDQSKKPENLMSENNYVDLLVDLQHIITWRNARPDSISADSLKEVIYDRYGLTEEQFEASHTYYQQQVEKHLVRIDEVIRRLEGESSYIEAHIDSLKKLRMAEDSLSVEEEQSD